MRISGIFSKTKTTNLIGGFYSTLCMSELYLFLWGGASVFINANNNNRRLWCIYPLRLGILLRMQ